MPSLAIATRSRMCTVPGAGSKMWRASNSLGVGRGVMRTDGEVRESVVLMVLMVVLMVVLVLVLTAVVVVVVVWLWLQLLLLLLWSWCG